MDLILATTNTHKIREFRSLLKQKKIGCDIYSLIDFPGYVPPEETGVTFEENAALKAISAATSLNKWVLADDSGLVVPAIGGAPGVYSARYAGPNATDQDNRKKLLNEMKDLEGLARAAYFECSLVLASPDGKVKVFKGLCEGTLITKERGRHGFGYDALFLKHDYKLTFAELDETVKNQISHRAKAFEKLFPSLQTLCLN